MDIFRFLLPFFSRNPTYNENITKWICLTESKIKSYDIIKIHTERERECVCESCSVIVASPTVWFCESRLRLHRKSPLASAASCPTGWYKSNSNLLQVKFSTNVTTPSALFSFPTTTAKFSSHHQRRRPPNASPGGSKKSSDGSPLDSQNLHLLLGVEVAHACHKALGFVVPAKVPNIGNWRHDPR